MFRWILRIGFLVAGILPAVAGEADEPAVHRLPDAQAGNSYSYRIPTAGGEQPLSWSADGRLPEWLELDARNGILSGTPPHSSAQPVLFEVIVTDSSSPPQSAAMRYALRIAAAPLRILPPESAFQSVGAQGVSKPAPVSTTTAAPTSAALSGPLSRPEAEAASSKENAPPREAANESPVPAGPQSSGGKTPYVDNVPGAAALSSNNADTVPVSSILLVGHDQDDPDLTFAGVEGPSHGTVSYRQIAKTNRGYALYSPDPGYVGQDAFTFKATDSDGNESNVGTVTVSVRRAGLKWEILGGAATGLPSAETGSTSTDGKTLPHFLFRLDWLIAPPATDGTAVFSAQNGPLTVRESDRSQWSAHTLFETGFVTRPVMLQNTASDTRTLSYQRAFTVDAELNFNYVRDADHLGAFWELGPLVRSALDIFIDDDDFSQDANGVNFIRLTREDAKRAFYRFEAGVRFALKQSQSSNTTIFMKRPSDTADAKGVMTKLGRGNTTGSEVYPKNLRDLLVIEAVYNRNDALSSLATNPLEDTENRFAVRFFAYPILPNAPKGYRFLIGAELDRDFNGGTQDVRIFYGFNIEPTEIL